MRLVFNLVWRDNRWGVEQVAMHEMEGFTEEDFRKADRLWKAIVRHALKDVQDEKEDDRSTYSHGGEPRTKKPCVSLDAIRKAGIMEMDSLKKIAQSQSQTAYDPLPITTVLEHSGLDYALRACSLLPPEYAKAVRLMACEFAERVAPIWTKWTKWAYEHYINSTNDIETLDSTAPAGITADLTIDTARLFAEGRIPASGMKLMEDIALEAKRRTKNIIGKIIDKRAMYTLDAAIATVTNGEDTGTPQNDVVWASWAAVEASRAAIKAAGADERKAQEAIFRKYMGETA